MFSRKTIMGQSKSSIGNEWLFEDDNGKWIRYDNSDDIEKAFIKDSEKKYKYISNIGAQYTLDFKAAIQKNDHTKKTRRICRSPISTNAPVGNIKSNTQSVGASVNAAGNDLGWFFQDDNKQWVKYKKSNYCTAGSDDIEKAFKSNKENYYFKINYETYEIDFSKQIQTNIKTKKHRKIKRLAANSQSASGTLRYTWSCFDEDGKKVDLSTKQCQENKSSVARFIDDKYAKDKNDTFCVTTNGTRFAVNLNKMTINNIETNQSRPIVCEPNSYTKSSKFDWFYSDDEGHWTMYGKKKGDTSSAEIERYYLSRPHNKSQSITVNGQPYTIDFVNNTQKSVRTGAIRNILRDTQDEITKRNASAIKMPRQTSHSDDSFEWQFLDENNKWITYGNNSSGKLRSTHTNVTSNDIEKEYQNNFNQGFHIENKYNDYFIDFKQMIQRNTKTGVTRRIQRIPGTGNYKNVSSRDISGDRPRFEKQSVASYGSNNLVTGPSLHQGQGFAAPRHTSGDRPRFENQSVASYGNNNLVNGPSLHQEQGSAAPRHMSGDRPRYEKQSVASYGSNNLVTGPSLHQGQGFAAPRHTSGDLLRFENQSVGLYGSNDFVTRPYDGSYKQYSQHYSDPVNKPHQYVATDQTSATENSDVVRPSECKPNQDQNNYFHKSTTCEKEVYSLHKDAANQSTTSSVRVSNNNLSALQKPILVPQPNSEMLIQIETKDNSCNITEPMEVDNMPDEKTNSRLPDYLNSKQQSRLYPSLPNLDEGATNYDSALSMASGASNVDESCFRPHWAPMDAAECILVQLHPGDKEYDSQAAFMKKTLPYISILNIQRIQNKKLWNSFTKAKTNLQKSNADTKVKDILCFYGIDGSDCQYVYQNNCTAEGKPLHELHHFSSKAKGASLHKDDSGVVHLFIVRVTMCRLTTLETLPPDCDTRVDLEYGPTMFFKNNQDEYYPEYYIELKI